METTTDSDSIDATADPTADADTVVKVCPNVCVEDDATSVWLGMSEIRVDDSAVGLDVSSAWPAETTAETVPSML